MTSTTRAGTAALVALAVAIAGCTGQDQEPREEAAAPAAPSGAADRAEAAIENAAPEGTREDVTEAMSQPAEAPEAPPVAERSATQPAARTAPAAAAPSDDLHPSELYNRIGLELPEAPMGKKDLGTSLLEDQFAANPELRPDDPEVDSVLRGRRLVGPVDLEFRDAFDTPEELAEAYLDALFHKDDLLLHLIRISQEEHEKIFWYEYPESRPITNATAHDAWTFHNMHCMDGAQEALNRYGGRRLWLQDIRYTVGIARYRNFNLYQGVQIIAADEEGGPLVTIEQAPVFAERNGKWKMYIYKD